VRELVVDVVEQPGGVDGADQFGLGICVRGCFDELWRDLCLGAR
jgi:hypothetical protein